VEWLCCESNGATRAACILINDRRDNIHSVVRPGGGGAYHKPA
jgi:hypothetical protein